VLRFIWNSTRGYRFTPWRSPFLRWRIETFSSKSAESLTRKDVLNFLWVSRWELLAYLSWTAEIDREARRKA